MSAVGCITVAMLAVRQATIEECACIAECSYSTMSGHAIAKEAARRIRALLTDDAECDALHHNEDDSSAEAPGQAL